LARQCYAAADKSEPSIFDRDDPGKRGALLAARRSSGGSKRRAGHVMETLTFEIADAFSRASEMR